MTITSLSGSSSLETASVAPAPIEKVTLPKQDVPTPLTPSKADSFTLTAEPRKTSDETSKAEETETTTAKTSHTKTANTKKSHTETIVASSTPIAKPNNTLALVSLAFGVVGTALGGAGLFLAWKEGQQTNKLFEHVKNMWAYPNKERYDLFEKTNNFVRNNLDGLSEKAIKEFETAELSKATQEGRDWLLSFINLFKHQEFKPPSSNGG